MGFFPEGKSVGNLGQLVRNLGKSGQTRFFLKLVRIDYPFFHAIDSRGGEAYNRDTPVLQLYSCCTRLVHPLIGLVRLETHLARDSGVSQIRDLQDSSCQLGIPRHWPVHCIPGAASPRESNIVGNIVDGGFTIPLCAMRYFVQSASGDALCTIQIRDSAVQLYYRYRSTSTAVQLLY
jgi:hypothetical protein